MGVGAAGKEGGSGAPAAMARRMAAFLARIGRQLGDGELEGSEGYSFRWSFCAEEGRSRGRGVEVRRRREWHAAALFLGREGEGEALGMVWEGKEWIGEGEGLRYDAMRRR